MLFDMRYVGTRKVLFNSSTQPLTLLKVGPFASGSTTPVASLPNRTVSGFTDIYGTIAQGNLVTNALRVNTLTLNAGANAVFFPDVMGTSTAYIWADTIISNAGATITSFAGDGTAGIVDTFLPFPDYVVIGGDGGSGGAGGGGGGVAMDSGGGDGFGGGAGNARDGGSTGDAFGSYFPTAGAGGLAYTYADPYLYGLGGDGSPGANFGGAGGLSDTGGGGAGGGGGSTCTGTDAAAGGGGGAGGGLLVICCRVLTINTSTSFRADAGQGGSEASAGAAVAGPGGIGGGGVIWVAAKKYNGLGSAFVDGYLPGTAQIFEITRSNTLVERTFLNSWDNT
jgi:hypothetical protein